jgi:Xaa-Pro dipeptidase
MDDERAQWTADLLRRRGYDALICRLPEHVVMLTGFQPILGTTFCLLTPGDGGLLTCRLALPEQERDRLPDGLAVDVGTYAEETMSSISTTVAAVRAPLRQLLDAAGLASDAVVGYERDQPTIAPAYTQVGFPGAGTVGLLRELLPGARLRDATDDLGELAARKTSAELDRIRRSVRTAGAGFEAARSAVCIGATEADVAAAATAALLRAGYAAGAGHVLAFAHVMAGRRAAAAFKAYNLTSNGVIRQSDCVLVQIELCLDGYWAEVTRTFFAGNVSEHWCAAHEACVAAQDAALCTIRDGVSGKDADGAAREVMSRAGFGAAFKHGLGHGFGFQAINHAAGPILHPASRSVLRSGMVHNLEPAVYLYGEGGYRLNDDVLVGPDGAERLSIELPRGLEWLRVPQA